MIYAQHLTTIQRIKIQTLLDLARRNKELKAMRAKGCPNTANNMAKRAQQRLRLWGFRLAA